MRTRQAAERQGQQAIMCTDIDKAARPVQRRQEAKLVHSASPQFFVP
ncbi:hypothetical protein HMPREF9946_03591 [Acetobacteraceae bacterium AT-5844]|nr:hypothetical protein HMPREF9946_03591 [Acetobacteraceae bacterium AT-5844]